MTAASPPPVHLLPWTELARFGVPVFRVSLRPIFYNGEVIPVGTVLTPEVSQALLSNTTRLRQYYEQRRIVPVDGYLLPADAARRVNEEARNRTARAVDDEEDEDEQDEEEDDEYAPLLLSSTAPLPIAEESGTPQPAQTPASYTPGRKNKKHHNRNRR